MELRLLRSFQALAQQGHFGRAARSIHVSQPALTKQMRQLEDEVGGQLFTRGRHGAQLTSAGVLFLPWMSGSIAPSADARMRGGFLNLSLHTTRSHMARAVLDRLARGLAHDLGPKRVKVLRHVGLRDHRVQWHTSEN